MAKQLVTTLTGEDCETRQPLKFVNAQTEERVMLAAVPAVTICRELWDMLQIMKGVDLKTIDVTIKWVEVP